MLLSFDDNIYFSVLNLLQYVLNAFNKCASVYHRWYTRDPNGKLITRIIGGTHGTERVKE